MINVDNPVGKILYSEEDILRRAKELGKQITEDYKDEELILVGTLKGAVLWMSDLMKCIDLNTQIDFICASSYGSDTVSSGVVKISKDVEIDIKDKHVLIVEDIVDSGFTLSRLKNYFLDRDVKSLKICTLLDKPSRRVVDVDLDYVGFQVDDLFIIGYGLDYDQRFRNLPYISYLEE